MLRLSGIEKEVLAEEIRAQVVKCKDNGLPLTHVDSHHNIHEEWAIGRVLIPILKEFEIPYLRIMQNFVPARTIRRRMYTIAYNKMLKLSNLARTEYFGSIYDYLNFMRTKGAPSQIKSFEVMIHPTINAENVVVEAESNKPLDELIKQIDVYEEADSFSSSKYYCQSKGGSDRRLKLP